MFSWAPLTQPQPILYLALGEYRHIQCIVCPYLPLSGFLSALIYSISNDRQEKFLTASAGAICSDLGSSLPVEQYFLLFPSGAGGLQACSFIPSGCHFIIQLMPQQHIPSAPPPLPSASRSSSRTCSCLCLAKKWLKHVWLSPRGDGLLFNAGRRILPVSCVHINKLQGVSPVAVGVINYWVRQFNIGDK